MVTCALNPTAESDMTSCESHDDCVVVYTGYGCPMCRIEKAHEKQLEEKQKELNRINAEWEEALRELDHLRPGPEELRPK